MLSFYYHELMRKMEEHKGRNYLKIDDYVLYKVLGKIKKN